MSPLRDRAWLRTLLRGRRSTSENLAHIKIWNAAHTVVYSDNHRLIGQAFHAASDLQNALDGHPNEAEVITPRAGTETAGELGLGELLEVYVPLRFSTRGKPVGAFEIYLNYRPIAASIARDERTVALVVAIGLALLWASLFVVVVGRASRRLRRQSRENHMLARLLALGCDTGQGFLISRPAPAAELTAWLTGPGARPARASGRAPHRSSSQSASR